MYCDKRTFVGHLHYKYTKATIFLWNTSANSRHQANSNPDEDKIESVFMAITQIAILMTQSWTQYSDLHPK